MRNTRRATEATQPATTPPTAEADSPVLAPPLLPTIGVPATTVRRASASVRYHTVAQGCENGARHQHPTPRHDAAALTELAEFTPMSIMPLSNVPAKFRCSHSKHTTMLSNYSLAAATLTSRHSRPSSCGGGGAQGLGPPMERGRWCRTDCTWHESSRAPPRAPACKHHP